jgi:hypothetical protein
MKGNLWAALEEGVLVIEDIFGAASPQAINVEFGASGIGTIVLDITHDLVRSNPFPNPQKGMLTV